MIDFDQNRASPPKKRFTLNFELQFTTTNVSRFTLTTESRMTIPLLSSQKHDSFLDKHGAALGAARSGLCYKRLLQKLITLYVVTVDTPRLFNCGVRVLLRSAATCPLSLAPLRARLARFRASMRWPMHARSRPCSGLTAPVPLLHPLPD